MRGSNPSRAPIKPAANPKANASKGTVAAPRGFSDFAETVDSSHSKLLPRDRRASLITLAAIVLLCATHIYYAFASHIPPSTDEAHYMSGSLSIAQGLRS